MNELSGARRQSPDKPRNIPLWYAASAGFAILGISVLSAKWLWTYNHGYLFLALVLAGLFAKFIIDPAKK